MEATLSKSDLRVEGLKRRDAVPDELRGKLARRLASEGEDLALSFAATLRKPVVSLYAAIGSEPDPMLLAHALIKDAMGLALPVDWSTGHELLYRRWVPGDRLAHGPLGIAEPIETARPCDPDILFVPLTAFDRRGFRLGYGAANVDRTLVALRNRKAVRVIGVAFAAQEMPSLPAEPHDEPLDFVITEVETIRCGF